MLYNDVTKFRYSNYWHYFEIVRKYMPQNCSSDIQAAISHIDEVFASGSQPEIDAIKAKFGFEDLTYLADVVAACK